MVVPVHNRFFTAVQFAELCAALMRFPVREGLPCGRNLRLRISGDIDEEDVFCSGCRHFACWRSDARAGGMGQYRFGFGEPLE
jgi:hypothetical protein